MQVRSTALTKADGFEEGIAQSSCLWPHGLLASSLCETLRTLMVEEDILLLLHSEPFHSYLHLLFRLRSIFLHTP